MGAAGGGAPLTITPDNLGKLYAASLRAEGMRDKGTPVQTKALVQAFSNMLSCFVPPAKK